ncbi:hypothetical protein BGX28_010194 [Mortierella sp. GBA30]|nr:hypothetical protein BGX28_010194 [Mortierella sp. GBA30]
MPVSCACGSLSGHVPTTVATASVTQLLPIDESLASQPSSTQQDFTGRNIERPPQAMQPSAAALAHHPVPSISVSANTTQKDAVGLVTSPPLCQYHTMIYKTTPSTTLYLHSHDYRSINHQDHNEVTGYRYHDRNNDWIVSRPDEGDEIANDERDENPQDTEQIDSQWRTSDPGPSSSGGVKPTPGSTIHLDKQPYSSRSPFLQWKDVFWLKHATTGKYFNSMASLKISQGFQEVSALGAPHSNNDWIIEETTWLRQQILSDE